MKSKLLLCLCLLITLLVACSSTQAAPQGPGSINQQGTTIAGFSIGPRELDESRPAIRYDGQFALLPYQIRIKSDHKLALVLFLDGEPQPFAYSGDGEKSFSAVQAVHIFTRKSDMPQDLTLRFVPIKGHRGESLALYVMGVLNPDYLPSGKAAGRGEFTQVSGFGGPTFVEMQANAPSPGEALQTPPTVSVDKQPSFLMYAGQRLNAPKLYAQKGSLMLNLRMMGQASSYRAVVFVDNQPVLLDGQSSVLMQADSSEAVVKTVSVKLDASIKEASIYAVFVPLGGFDALFPFRSEARLLVNQN